MQTTAYADREILVGSLKLHYQEWGDASRPPMILLHGFGVSGHMFDEVALILRDGYQLFCIDQRGHGDSEWSSEGDYSRDAFVSDLEGFRRALGIEKFVLVGHSMGGLNAVTYAGRHPERVEKLILVDVGPEAVKEGVDNIIRFTRGPDNLDFEQFVEMAHAFNPRRTVDNIRDRMKHRLRPTEDGKWTWKFDKRFRDTSSGIVVGSELSTEDTWNLFRAVPVPTLLIRGGDSDVLSQPVAEAVTREMPTARLVVVEGAGHSVPGDAPEAFSEAVLAFLSEPALPDAGQLQEEGPSPDQGDGDAARQQAAAREILRAELAASDVRTPARVTREPRGRSLIVVVGAATVAVVALVFGVRSLRRRRRAAQAGPKQRVRRLRSAAERDARAVQARATATFDELTALGRQRLEQAMASPALHETIARAKGDRPKSRRNSEGGRGRPGGLSKGYVARLARKGAKRAGTLALTEGQDILRRGRRRRSR